MSGNIKFVFFATLILMCFTNCKTVETYIENDGNDYAVFLIETNTMPFSYTYYRIDNYTLSANGSASQELSNGKIETRKYIFYEGNVELCKLEVTEETRKGFFIFGSYENYIKITYPDAKNDSFEINPLTNSDSEESYMVFQNDSSGTITVKRYLRAITKEDREHLEHPMGFEFFVNNEQYGILALSPLAFHLRVPNKLDRNMALYIFATLVSRGY